MPDSNLSPCERGRQLVMQFTIMFCLEIKNQIVFHVSAETQLGENIYIVGNIPELGNWNPDNCTESMLNPNYPEWFLPVSVPSGTTIEFKFIKKMP